jgi:hypothetical protein
VPAITARTRFAPRRLRGYPARCGVLVFASRLTPVLSLLGLAATVCVAARYSSATDGLTFVVLVLTAYLVLLEPKRRFEQRELFWRYMADAVYETCHNLQHIAKAYEPDTTLVRWPQFHVLASLRLLDPPFNDYMLRVEPRLWPHLDHMVRNEEYLRRYPFTTEGAIAARAGIGYFVEHGLRFVIAAGRAREGKVGPYVIETLETLGRPSLTALAMALPGARFHVRMTASAARADVAARTYGLAGDEQPLWWFGDDEDPHALWHDFRAFDDPPPRLGLGDCVIRV